MENNKYSIEQAKVYQEKYSKVINKNFKPLYHFSSPIGWVNDPNGLININGKFHVFFQFNPYSTNWDSPFWGHAISDDLIKFTFLPCAIAPNDSYDNYGCFSGTAMYENDVLTIFYTGNSKKDGESYQSQCIARSSDLITFIKDENNPIIESKSLYLRTSSADFRDPFLIKYNSKYYLLIATKRPLYPLIVCYESQDLKKWKIAKRIFGKKSLGNTFECPNAAILDNKKTLLIFSSAGLSPKKSENSSSKAVYYSIINFRSHDNELSKKTCYIVDYGFDFYAPQIFKHNGEIIMLGWLDSGTHNNTYDFLKFGWAGSYSLARVLNIDEKGKLIQTPYKGLNKYKKKKVIGSYNISSTPTNIDVIKGNAYHLSFALNFLKGQQILLKLMSEGNNCFKILFDEETKTISLDRSNCTYRFVSNDENEDVNFKSVDISDLNISPLKVDIYVDVSIVEIFLDDGRKVLSSLAFNKPSADKVYISSKTELNIDVSYESILTK